MKTPVIRPGQRKPYVKATRQQINERLGFVARWLRAGRTKFQIHRAVREKYGVEWRQCDRYISWLTHPRTLASITSSNRSTGISVIGATKFIPDAARTRSSLP